MSSNKLKSVWAIIPVLAMITGCGGATESQVMSEKRTFLPLSYLNTTDSQGDMVEVAKQDAGKYVKWTAHVLQVVNDKKVILLEENQLRVEANFAYDIKNEIQPNSIVTVSGKLDGKLDWGQWVLDNCRLETTSPADKKTLLAYEATVAQQDKKYNQQVVEDYDSKTKSIGKLVVPYENQFARVLKTNDLYNSYEAAKEAADAENQALSQMQSIDTAEWGSIPQNVQDLLNTSRKDFISVYSERKGAYSEAMQFFQDKKLSQLDEITQKLNDANALVLQGEASVIDAKKAMGLPNN